ncbi:MAG: hypothetical protein LC127_04945 [Chitinophagales bacterium]|nr:hypothetical protein [Chitinophagales bacterium]
MSYGNTGIGIIIYENSDSNTVYSNFIGVKPDGSSALPNNRAGIVITGGSSYNMVGMPNKGNIIAYNDTVGILIDGNNTLFNTISANQIYANPMMDIDITPLGVNNNDVADADVGPNEKMNYPVILNAAYDPLSDGIYISGTMDCATYGGPQGLRIELFKSDGANFFNHGGAQQYLGYTIVNNSSGTWDFIGTGATQGDKITATATDIKGNTLSSLLILR